MRLKQFPFKATLKIAVFSLLSFYACKDQKQATSTSKAIINTQMDTVFFKLSLAQWSLNKQIRSGEMDPLDFAQKASELGFEGIEYVSQLYANELKKDSDPNLAMDMLLKALKEKSDRYHVENVLIMVDGEGDLASADELKRNEAVENHKKWVYAAQFLGCHSIRVNLSGSNNPEVWTASAIDGLSKLASYAAEKNINVIVENHGGLSSNAAMLVNVIQKVNASNCGVLPDFGNFCIKKEGSKCVEDYNRYEGVAEMMPYAKAVSAKSYDFDETGDETTIDYVKMLEHVKEAGYTGFIGVEYEGNTISEEKGIEFTRNLLIKVAKQLQ